MCAARGFATGKGRSPTGGVCGGTNCPFCDKAGSSTADIGSGLVVWEDEEGSAVLPDESFLKASSRVFGGGGSEVLGDGGGSTNDVGSIDLRGAWVWDCVLDGEGGTCMGINSVSYAGSILVGGGIENMGGLQDARVLRPLADFPTIFCFRGDLRIDLFGEDSAKMSGTRSICNRGAAGGWVSCCSCQIRFSSKKSILSFWITVSWEWMILRSPGHLLPGLPFPSLV